MSEDEYVRRKDAARLAHRAATTIDRLARQGKLTKYADGLGRPLFRRAEILALIRPRKVVSA